MTKDAEKLLARLYKRYKAAVDSGTPRSQARFLGDADEIHERDWPEICTDDITALCIELDREGYLDIPAEFCVPASAITPKGIEYMENRFKNSLLGAADIISKFRP